MLTAKVLYTTTYRFR